MAQLSSALHYSCCFPGAADMLPLSSSSTSMTSSSTISLVESSYTFCNDTHTTDHTRTAVHVEQASSVKKYYETPDKAVFIQVSTELFSNIFSELGEGRHTGPCIHPSMLAVVPTTKVSMAKNMKCKQMACSLIKLKTWQSSYLGTPCIFY